MQILHVKEYNRLEMQKYEKKWDEVADDWKAGLCYPPQQAFYGFYTRNGQFRQSGYVAFNEKRAVVRKTKKEAIAAFYK